MLKEALICWAFLLANFTPMLRRMEGQALGRPKRFKGIGWVEKVGARKKKKKEKRERKRILSFYLLGI